MAGQGAVRQGKAGQGLATAGWVLQRESNRVLKSTSGRGQEWRGKAWPGTARYGPARLGMAWLGKARRGEVFLNFGALEN
jgi:hypothetical protein